MGKTRVGVILREKVGGNKSSSRSGDLVTLTERYHAFSKKLHQLIQVLSNYHASLLRQEQARFAVAQTFADLSRNTPLWDAVGLMPSAERPANSVCSYASTQDLMSSKSKSYADKFKQFVLEYVVEWEKVVTNRVNNGLKTAEQLRRDLDHYQKKVETLRLAANQAMAKGKSVTPANTDKLARNEEKLLSSRQVYNQVATDLCLLIEEVTERAWRDLHPLLIKVAQFDMTLSNDESKVFQNMNQVVDQLKKLATTHGLSAQPRLKDLASLKPDLLSTRPGGVAGYMIEEGPSSATQSSGPNSYHTEPMALPPGATAPQGLGGFPVQVPSPPTYGDPPAANQMSRTSSFSSVNSGFGSLPNVGSNTSYEPPSTLSMLAISQSAAPAPTFEDVYASTYTGPISPAARSAPGSGNLPPLPPRGSRTSSMNDADSFHSGYGGMGAVAPAPAGPPPPPPSQPPPPPPSYGLPPMATATVVSPYGSAAPSQPYYLPDPPTYSYSSNPSWGADPPAPYSASSPPTSINSHRSSGANPFDE